MMNEFNELFLGSATNAHELLGSFKKDEGVLFRVYAKNAHHVSLITSFNNWQEEFNLNKIDERGIFEVFIEKMEYIYSYRYRIYKNEFEFHDKIDPFAKYFERRPDNASVMYDLSFYKFTDNEFLQKKDEYKDFHKPMSIYEIHTNGFIKPEWQDLASYQDLKKYLIPYLKENGFTHLELMPLFEHPFDGSWGYQASGFYAITSRYGTPYDLMDFINECHLNDIKVILDVVYSHFVKDGFALCNYDHTNLFEYPDKLKKYSEWDSYYFDLSNPFVMSFLISSAHFFKEYYHFDGFRFDAVSHFIYHKGREENGLNLEGLNFIKKMNYYLNKNFPDIILFAEDSSAYPNVTKRVEHGGLGFDYKWDIGWMNDSLKYYAMDHEYRKYHHNLITFSMSYLYNENYILPLSHDEVVHGKKTILDKMFGTYQEKFALAKNFYLYMFTHPGKKLNFMGNELGLFLEFDESKEIEWKMLKYPRHDSFKRFFRDLNLIYRHYEALYINDYDPLSFEWIDVNNNQESIFSYLRYDQKGAIACVFNMLPITYHDYRIGVPYKGEYIEIMNSEKDIYNGCNLGNYEPLKAEKIPYHGKNYSLRIKIPPLGAVLFRVDLK